MVLIQDARDAYAGWMAAIDKRVVSWPLMANPWPTLAICLMYCLAAYILPKMLKGQGSNQCWNTSLCNTFKPLRETDSVQCIPVVRSTMSRKNLTAG